MTTYMDCSMDNIVWVGTHFESSRKLAHILPVVSSMLGWKIRVRHRICETG